MRKLLACLLLAMLPLTPSWAGVAVDCGSGTAIAAPADSPEPQETNAGDEGSRHDCCQGEAAPEKPCGQDCSQCHGAGITALGTPDLVTGVVAACPGTTAHASRLATPLPDETFRPPAPASA